MVRLFALIALLLTLCSLPAFAQVAAAPSLMNFQGQLSKPDGTPVPNGNYSIRFSLHSALTGGTERWNQTLNPVAVRNGTFAVLLSGFPSGTFNANLWLEIKVGTNAALTPRQQLVTVAYAFKANSVADEAITTDSLANAAVTNPKIASGAVGTNKIANNAVTNAKIANGAITADKFAADLLNPLAWLLGGNSGVTTGFLGTTDNQPLVFKVNNRRAMQYQYAENVASLGFEYRSVNVLGGSEINEIGVGVVGATIAGGGFDYFSWPDFPNRVLADFGTVAGGLLNTANGIASTVAGGASNVANGNYSAVAGGRLNVAGGAYSFAAGRRAKANHDGAFVWGGSADADFASTAAN